MTICGAKNRSGQPCKRPAGWGTDHVGTGKCKLHGGASLKGAQHPNFKTGVNSIYRDYLPDGIKSKVEAFENADPLDLTHELAVTRALLADFLSRFVEGTRLDAISISIASDLVDRINKTVATISKIKNDTALTGAEVTFLAAGIVALLDRYVDDPTKREAFKQELFSLALPADTITIE